MSRNFIRQVLYPAINNLLHRYANPARFMRMSARVAPWLAGITILLAGAGLYLGLFVSPADYQQSETVPIMYAPASYTLLTLPNIPPVYT